MSKKSKKERNAAREAQRAALRRQERQRNVFTVIVIGIVMAIGGLLIWVSLDGGDLEDLLADIEETPTPTPGASGEPSEEPSGQPSGEPAADERPVACGADVPAGAGEDKPTHTEPEQVLSDGVAYQAVIETSCGRIVVDLDAEGAPEGVNSFVFLATTGFYDGLEIFRHALTIEVFQTGSGTDSTSFDIGYELPDELGPVEEGGYPAGSVAYANAGPGTSGSQFFLVYGEAFQDTVDAGGLQPIYTRFGTVTEGLDVLDAMAEIDVDGESPQEKIYMESVRILVDGEELPTDEREE